MFVRLILNYLKKQKMKKEIQLLQDELKNHSIKEPDPIQEEPEVKKQVDNDVELNLNLIESIDLNINNLTYTLSLEHASVDWEDDDILLSKTSSNNMHIHPWIFLQHVIWSKSNYIENQNNDFLKNIQNSNWFKFTYLEDSRDYPSITIEENPILIKCHYLCPVFYISNINGSIILITDNLYDENMDDIPMIFTRISNDLFNKTSAVFDREEEIWLNTNA